MRDAANPLSRITMLLGIAGMPLLISGVLSLNVRMCFAGAAISGIAVLISVASALR